MTTMIAKKTNHYMKGLVALAAPVIVAAGLLAASAMPAHAAATTFTVNQTGDPGDGLCNATCTLRDAIVSANSNPGADTINFNVSNGSGGLVQFNLLDELPAITEQVTINGYSQPGSSVNTREDSSEGINANPMIVLNGASAGSDADGLVITGSNTVVKGLRIQDFKGVGIQLPNAVSGVKIEGNHITDNGDTFDRGGVALTDGARSNIIGGSTPAQRNLISGNFGSGVSIIGNGSSLSNQVVNNVIGANTQGNGSQSNRGDGVTIVGSSSNRVERNNIAFNLGNGVGIDDFSNNTTNNSIRQNSIVSNAAEGIDLGLDGPTANDQDDADVGANDLQNFPVITSATNEGGKTTIAGTINSVPNTRVSVEFFSNPANTDEGRQLLGFTSVTTNSGGDASFAFESPQPVSAGANVTATATQFALTDFGTIFRDTSEFSAPRSVVAAADTTAPTVQSIVPANKATGVARTADVKATFSEAMNAGTITAATFKLKEAGASNFVQAPVSYDAAAKRATLNPSTDLKAGTTYVVKVTTGAEDLAGNQLDQNPNRAGNQAKSWRFTTGQ
ncbi:MAG: Ig-like domain-containing protein [Actinomycetota bacterium]|nr:Ig-like domain-containing protein [Actinomycetota bacterium]